MARNLFTFFFFFFVYTNGRWQHDGVPAASSNIAFTYNDHAFHGGLELLLSNSIYI